MNFLVYKIFSSTLPLVFVLINLHLEIEFGGQQSPGLLLKVIKMWRSQISLLFICLFKHHSLDLRDAMTHADGRG